MNDMNDTVATHHGGLSFAYYDFTEEGSKTPIRVKVNTTGYCPGLIVLDQAGHPLAAVKIFCFNNEMRAFIWDENADCDMDEPTLKVPLIRNVRDAVLRPSSRPEDERSDETTTPP